MPPDNPEAWYAPDVQAQYELRPDVVATARETDDAFAYDVRESRLSTADWHALERVRNHFERANLRRPRTRKGTAERMAAGFSTKYRRALERLTEGARIYSRYADGTRSNHQFSVKDIYLIERRIASIII